MKKIATLLAIVLISALTAIGQTIVLNEDFESAPYDLTSSGSPAWGINTRLQSSGTSSDSCTVGLSSTTYLTSTAFSTSSNSSVILEFKHICKIEMGDAAQLEYSINGGTTWTTITTANYIGSGSFASNKFTEFSYPTTWQAGTATAVPQNSWWKTEQFDLGALVGNQASVMIRFKLNDANNSGPAQRLGWYIDDVKVTIAPSELVPPTITYVPTIWQDTVYNPGPFVVKAAITDASGIASATLHYAVNGGSYNSLPMAVLVGDTFSSIIPAQAYNTHIDYYITAIDASLASNTATSSTNWFYTKQAPPVVIIGTGTATEYYLPCYGYYNYGWSAMVYSSNEIGASGYIDSLYFYVGNTPTAGYTMTTQRLMVAEVVDSVFASDAMPDSASMTTFMAGNVVWSGPGWYKFIPATPYYYSGTGHLLLYWINRDGSYVSGYPNFQYTATPVANKAKYVYSDTYSNVFPTSTGTLTTNRPNLKLAFAINTTVHNVAMIQMPEPLTVPTPVTGTPYDVKVKIKNIGSDTLTNVTINWTLNGVPQTPYSWAGTLLQDQISSDITIGSVTFASTGNNVIKAWTSNPDGFADEMPLNDTISKTLYVCTSVLAGTYTINPIVPTGGTNFQYFSDVENTLFNCGISDTTVFQIASGTYDTLLTFSYIPGAGPTASVVFESASGNASDVIIQNNASSATNNYVITLAAAKYMTFRNMTMKALGSSFSKVLEISGGSNHITIENNIISSVATTSTGTDAAVINSSSTALDTNIVIRNNEINNGSYGIYLYGGGSTTLENGNVIENNVFSNYYYRGIYSYYQKNIRISGNVFKTNTAYTTSVGAYLCYNDNATITKNDIRQPSYYGIYYYYCDGTVTSPANVSNNFITVGGTSTAYGLYVYYSYYANIYHNSINITGASGTNGRALYLYSTCGNLDIKDNILASTGTGYAFYAGSTSLVFTSDYNNLYTAGSAVGYYGVNIADLAAWQSTALRDSNSVSMNPGFITNTNLHTFSVAMNDLGHPAGILDDIDNEVRSLATPDLGADEYTPAAEDAGVLTIIEPVMSPIPVAGNLYNVSVEIMNYGTDTLESATIDWSLDGAIQTSYLWTGSVLPGATGSSVTIGTVTFPTPGTHVIKAWTSIPNGVVDPNQLNDTTETTYFVCETVLAGTYTIDPLTPTGGTNFQYFSEVISSLHNCGISDTTIFDIASGTYDTLLTFTGIIPGSGPNACVIFESASGINTDVVLQHTASASANNYIVKLSGTSRVQFKNMTLQSLGTTYGSCVLIADGSHYNLFEGNIIAGPATTSTGSDMALVNNTSTANDTNNIIRNNVLNNGSYGIYWYGVGSTNLESGSVIEGNTFSNFYYRGIYSYYQKGLIIDGNILNSTSAYSSIAGMQLNYSDYSVVEMNKISVPTYYGIYFYYSDGDTTTHSRFINNMVHVGGTSTAYPFYGYYSNYVDLYHNTFNTTSTSTSARSVYLYYGGTYAVKNNFITNTGGGYSFYVYYSSPFTSDYNNIYSTGSILSYYNADMATLGAWQTATSGDANSLSTNPVYYNNASNLHTMAFSINNTGTPLGIVEDIDGEIRSLTTPDMGADEYNSPPFEAQLVSALSPSTGCTMGTEDVTIRIKNNGNDTIDGGLTATYVVNSGTPVTESVTDTIVPMDYLDFTFSVPVDMFVGTGNDSLFNFEVWVVLAGDTINFNDSITFSAISMHSPSSVTVTNATIPYGTNTTLTATSADTIQWFADPALSILLAQGTSFTTPVLYDTAVYYVASTSAVDRTYTFDSDLQGWTASTPCAGYATYNWAWASDGGAGAAWMVNATTYSSAVLKSPVIPVFGDSIELSFRHRYYTESCCDRGYVAYRIDGGAWTHFTPTTGLYAGSDNLNVDPILAACVSGPTVGTFGGSATSYFVSSGRIPLNGGTQIEIAFAFSSDVSLGYDGWFIDEVNLHKDGCPGPISPDTVFLTGVPAADLGVISIDQPNSGIELTNNETVQVHIVNYGTAPATNFNVSYQVNSMTPVTELFTGTIPSGDTAVYTFTNSANLVAFATYAFKAYPTIAGDIYPTNDTAYKTVTNAPLIYCNSTATNTADEDILNVTIGSLNNTSPSPHTMLYTDYTSVPAPYLALGQTYTMSVTETDDAASYYSGYVEAYIDFNHDGIYTEPEEVVLGGAYTNANATNIITGSVTIPLTATMGTTGMRIVCMEGGTAATTVPCGTYSYGETEDYMVTLAPQIPYDAGVISIDEPGYIQAESSVVPVVVSVKNFGTNTLTSIPVSYEANGNAPVTFTWTGSLASGDTVQITLPNVLVIADSNDICAYTQVVNDSNTFNDQECAFFFGLPPTIMFEDDMEGGTLLYTTDTILWQHGIPTASVINTAHSPDNVWATVIDGNYPNSADGYLYTPTINFFGVSGAYLTFYYWIESEANSDGAFVQYSVNNGATWSSLGSIGDALGFNWFDSFVSTTPGWSGSSGGWVPAYYKVDVVSGYSSVKFRFGFKSNTSTTFNGFAIDDIKILAPHAAIDGGVVEIVTPSASTVAGVPVTVNVKIANFGTDTLTTIPLSYAINTGYPPQNGTWTGTLLPGDTTDFTFTQTYPGPASDYELCAYTKITGDPYKGNDTTCVSLIDATGIEETAQEGVSLYQNTPNPAADHTQISFILPEPGNCIITLRNAIGDVIYSTAVDGEAGRNDVEFDLRSIEQGLYFYTLEYNDVVLTRKMSVLK